MANHKQKLELTWIGKDNRPRLEPRNLLEDPEKSYHAGQRLADHDMHGNHLILGDNFLELKRREHARQETLSSAFSLAGCTVFKSTQSAVFAPRGRA